MDPITRLWSTGEGKAVAVSAALLVLILSLLSLLLLHRRQQRRKLHLPPSPFPSLPLLGDLLHLRNLRRSANFVQDLRDKLGPIFTLYIGTTPIVYITSSALAHEALVQKGLLFAARPQSPSSRALFTNNFRGISSATYGPHWRTMRRNLVHEMLSMPRIISFKPIRNRVLDDLVSRVSAEARTNDGVAALFPNLRTAMFQLLLFMCFGFDMSEDALKEICTLMDEALTLSFGSLLEFYPFLRVFASRRQRLARAVRAKQVRMYTSHIEKHKELGKLGQLAPGSYLETLLHMDARTALSTEDLVTLCSEFLVGGTDTTVTTLEWTMACLVADPQVQNKLYNEISDIVGSRLVGERDLPNLPYLQAVIKETLRLHPPGHFVLPHAVSEPCKVGGYDIPKNAMVQFHVASISRDEQIWDEPLKFKPERFLSTNVDITGTKEVTMMPFGAGRRICPGLGLASIHLELFVARLVQAFEWANPAGDTVDMEEKPVFTIRMKTPLRALVKERSSIKVL